jgi:hypothetical protein
MSKKKKNNIQNEFSSPDTNPELNLDLEIKNEVFTEDDLDQIFDSDIELDEKTGSVGGGGIYTVYSDSV